MVKEGSTIDGVIVSYDASQLVWIEKESLGCLRHTFGSIFEDFSRED